MIDGSFGKSYVQRKISVARERGRRKTSREERRGTERERKGEERKRDRRREGGRRRGGFLVMKTISVLRREGKREGEGSVGEREICEGGVLRRERKSPSLPYARMCAQGRNGEKEKMKM